MSELLQLPVITCVDLTVFSQSDWTFHLICWPTSFSDSLGDFVHNSLQAALRRRDDHKQEHFHGDEKKLYLNIYIYTQYVCLYLKFKSTLSSRKAEGSVYVWLF